MLVTTDHKCLEDWVTEKVDTPSGPAARRARWHETLSKFDLTVNNVPVKDNFVADEMSIFADPACKAFQDTSFHGSVESHAEMKKIIEEELEKGRSVGLICVRPVSFSEVTTRRVLLVAGTMSRTLARNLPQHKI